MRVLPLSLVLISEFVENEFFESFKLSHFAGNEGGTTVRDKMTSFIFEESSDDSACREINKFGEENDMDTDAINIDVAILQEEGDSNLSKAVQHRLDVIKSLKVFMRRHRICSKSFGTGFKFNYWALDPNS